VFAFFVGGYRRPSYFCNWVFFVCVKRPNRKRGKVLYKDTPFLLKFGDKYLFNSGISFLCSYKGRCGVDVRKW
jgi:hypothetical protein